MAVASGQRDHALIGQRNGQKWPLPPAQLAPRDALGDWRHNDKQEVLAAVIVVTRTPAYSVHISS